MGKIEKRIKELEDEIYKHEQDRDDKIKQIQDLQSSINNLNYTIVSLKGGLVELKKVSNETK